jgi:hypothetical protein
MAISQQLIANSLQGIEWVTVFDHTPIADLQGNLRAWASHRLS